MAELDEFQITTAINNILSNAVKYSPDPPEIIFKAYDNNELVIIISDNGIGLSKEEQMNIFTKFYRANTGDLHNVKGLGLGLYYVKKIVEMHQGQVEVQSKPGKGSTFIIRLPIK